jgi:ABC-type multidrug transport system permease subunit
VPGIFTALFYFLAGFRVEGATFLVFLLVIITLHLVAVTQACLATSISRNIATASLISNVIFLTQTIFAGYLIQIPQLPYYVGWLKWIVRTFHFKYKT